MPGRAPVIRVDAGINLKILKGSRFPLQDDICFVSRLHLVKLSLRANSHCILRFDKDLSLVVQDFTCDLPYALL